MDDGLIFLPEATAILTLFPVKLQTRSVLTFSNNAQTPSTDLYMAFNPIKF